MKIFSLFNDKAKKGIQGRKESLRKVQTGFSKRDKVIWMHAASLGEYEQGLPVLEQLKYKLPDHKILITFFSPSGLVSFPCSCSEDWEACSREGE